MSYIKILINKKIKFVRNDSDYILNVIQFLFNKENK